jgi:hypothetical protein
MVYFLFIFIFAYNINGRACLSARHISIYFLQRIVSSPYPHIHSILFRDDFLCLDGGGIVRNFFELLEISNHELSQKNY